MPLFKMHWKLIGCCAGVLLTLLLVFYVYSINQLTRGVYLIKDYTKQVDGLLVQNRSLQTDSADNEFLARTMEKATAMNFVQTANIHYVQMPDRSLAEAIKPTTK